MVSQNNKYVGQSMDEIIQTDSNEAKVDEHVIELDQRADVDAAILNENANQAEFRKARERAITPGKRVAVIAVFVALATAFYYIPLAFLLPIILVSIWFDWKASLAMGIYFGVISYLFSYVPISPSLLTVTFVQYPHITILTRVPIGLVAHFAFRAMRKLCANGKSDFVTKILPVAVAAFLGSLINSVLVLGGFALCAINMPNQAAIQGLILATIPMAAGELAFNAIFAPLVNIACAKVLRRSSLRIGR